MDDHSNRKQTNAIGGAAALGDGRAKGIIRNVTIDPPTSASFDAVLLISFGGPQGMDDIRPFLANVLRGRRVPPHRVDEVAHHYELFGGVSPITELTMKQAAGVRARLERDGPALPVYVGMRNWHPYLADTLREMGGPAFAAPSGSFSRPTGRTRAASSTVATSWPLVARSVPTGTLTCRSTMSGIGTPTTGS